MMNCVGIPREEIHLTTKISPRESGFESTLNAINCSLVRLGVDYIDVCLIHWPGTAKFKPDDIEQVERRIQTWLALEHAKKQRIVRTIGVSNFLPRHIDSIISDPRTSIVPAINQIELHPLLLQKETTAYCSQKSIAVQSYSTLGQGNASLLEHPTISAIVNALRERMGCESVTSCHVCLRWAMQHGYAVIPRSSNPDRIEDNARALLLCDLNEIEMAAIDSISVHDGEKKFCWDPSPIC